MRPFLWEAGFWTLAPLLLLGVGCFFHFVLVPVLAPGMKMEYENRALFRSLDGWPSVYMIAHPLVYGLLFAATYRWIVGVEGSPTWMRGIFVGSYFGLVVFLVGSFPVYLLNYASFAVSPTLILSWVAQSVCQYVVAGAGLGWYSASAR